MKIKKKEIEPILTTLYFINQKEQKEYGLLTEDISMSLRRYLQKIRKELISVYDELREDIIEINKNFQKKAIEALPGEIDEKEYLDPKSEHNKTFLDKRKEFEKEQIQEFEKLMNEEFTLKSEKASLEMILAIKTSVNYDIDLIEKIAQ